MGTKIKISICILILSFLTFNVSAQRKLKEEAKGVALCECIRYMSLQSDSTSKLAMLDYSGGYFVQISELPLSITLKIQDFTRKYCFDFWAVPQDPNGNMIGYSCWQFYKSRELEHFIRRVIKEERKTGNKASRHNQ